MRKGGLTSSDLLVLLLLVVILANFFEAEGPGEVAIKWLLVSGITATVAARLGAARRQARGLALSSEGAALQARGRIVEALERFEAARPLLRRNTFLADFNAGQCHLELWRLGAAERAFTRAREGGAPPELHTLLAPRLALVLALQGAEDRAREELALSKDLEPEPGPHTLLAEAVLACRRQAWEEGRRRLSRQEMTRLGGTLRGLRDALLAWCHERGRGGLLHVDMTAVFAEAPADSLQQVWPELVRFLGEHHPRSV